MLTSTVVLASVLASLAPLALAGDNDKVYKYVAAFSVDGLHPSDVQKYIALKPQSAIASLLATGYEYTDARTSGPSDSFPGILNQFTGASPRNTGVWYDVIWDRSYFPIGSDCSGKPGAEVADDETLDHDPTKLFSGGINPLNLPKKLVGGKCVAIYPHQRLRVNTVFEVVHSKGKQTAYADKHPAYDIVRGPSGTGLSEGYFPEIASTPNTVDGAIGFDTYHVNAFLKWLDGASPDNAEGTLTGIPTLFGGNFQSVSVGQKTKGYLPSAGNPFTPDLLKALDFVDTSLGQVVAKLKAKNIYSDTLIIVASKHGQSPIDPALYAKVDPQVLIKSVGVPLDHLTTDDVALFFLKNQADIDLAVDNLNRHREEASIADIISHERLTYLGYGNPLTDPAVPDIIVRSDPGVIYTTSTKKIAEHGGLNDDDQRVACFVSSPSLKKTVYDHQVSTRQVAPTILQALGFDPEELQGVKLEDTKVLTGF
ncbi:MAG: hypothetical protein M1829_002289 [Trizodia sp. TS-e1964]|nr:MAG: hypothetical protein M1829_002289 [Trizodia sp. TS-e1964]